MVIGDCTSGGSSDNVSFKIKQWQNGQEDSEGATCETNKLGYFSKGQETSKGNCCVFKYPKKTTEIF